MSSRNLIVQKFQFLIITTVQLTKKKSYQLAYSNYSFSPSSSSSSSSSCAQSTFGRASLPVFKKILWYPLDFSSRYALISTSLSRSAGKLRPCFATVFWHFSSISYGFLIKIRFDHYLSPAQPAFGRASLPFSDIFTWFSMDFSSIHCNFYRVLITT